MLDSVTIEVDKNGAATLSRMNFFAYAGHTAWHKNWHTFFVRLNFIKCWPIFKLISLLESGENLQ